MKTGLVLLCLLLIEFPSTGQIHPFFDINTSTYGFLNDSGDTLFQPEFDSYECVEIVSGKHPVDNPGHGRELNAGACQQVSRSRQAFQVRNIEIFKDR